MPWGAASMGGKYPGKYPPKMRIVALVNIVVLMFLAIIVLSKAGLLFPQLLPFSKIAIWFVVVFLLLGSVMNSITPSKIERIWAPVAFIQFITSLIVALH
jgi:phosphoglycerol transferase MdoB-like AlkP superfamily enzyme